MITNHSITELVAHVVWATAQRARLLPPDVDRWMLARLHVQSREAEVELLGAGCTWDHVHVVVRWGPAQKLSEVVRWLKGGSSRMWNLEQTGRDPLAWQRGYWAETVTPDDLDGLLAYVARQRRRHALDPTLERWELAALIDS